MNELQEIHLSLAELDNAFTGISDEDFLRLKSETIRRVSMAVLTLNDENEMTFDSLRAL